ncbi:argininosuccinate lyase [Flavobacterium silvaticum]|uniref:Argininosuccinate lyase n=1 Tax=Flavobacterium silvaticum TaxID=1852020 RepID=A0A972JHJ3_9FLAO|nr:argininosuccinate lyase [Flavobacterium silvaticum]NMH27193.1 argininosuccinate lyase [Flavobacterium silvaticum]
MKIWEKGIPTNQKINAFTVGNDRELDLHLAQYDAIGSIAQAKMLASAGLISAQESENLVAALEEILSDISNGTFKIEAEFEDVHSKIEFLLIQKLGDAGRKIHTARSRNDQVLTDMHLYLKVEISHIKSLVKDLFDLLIKRASEGKDILIPGYTHMQIAMPSSFGLWFAGYAETLVDDVSLLNAAFKVVDQNALGSGAGYGSSFPIDRKLTTELLGFSDLKYNPIAAQMSRGKSEKITSFALSSVASTLSKLSDDIILYASQNFGFLSLPDDLTTGSSLMPHKKNPDVFELIRGKSNRIQALPYEITLLTNNLTSGYHRDFQLLKEGVFPAVENLKSCLELMIFGLANLKLKEGILSDEKYRLLFTVDALNELVAQGIPFRTAYQQIADEVQSGTFKSPDATRHTHEGSINNLCLEEIVRKMDSEC